MDRNLTVMEFPVNPPTIPSIATLNPTLDRGGIAKDDNPSKQ
jgi:hypothetical protein